MNWLVNKLRDGRLSMAIKELKWDINRADDKRRAKILLKVHHIRGEVLERSGVPTNVLEHPERYSRDFLMNIVGQLEDVIRIGEQQSNAAIAHAKTMGIDAKLMKSEMQFDKRATQLWIGTLGALDRHDAEMRDIWSKLHGSINRVPEVFREMIALASLTGETIADTDAVLSDLFSICSFVPSKYKD